MLKFVLGRSGYGKTEYVFSQIRQYVAENKDNILLITPEQYSLAAEKRLLKQLGEADVGKVQSYSFSTITDAVERIYGSETLPVLSKGAKVILMTQAIDACKDKLTLFSKKLDSLSFVNSVIDIYDEMKSCNLSGSEIQEMSQSISNEILKRKLGDISLIMNCYEESISDRFIDPSEKVKRLYDRIESKGFFKGKTVFIDGFNGFVAQEYKLLELVIAEAEDTYITLCTDSYGDDSIYNLFAYVNKSASILEKIAQKAGKKTEIIDLNTNHRALSQELLAVERNIFSDNKIDSIRTDGACSIYSARNISDECSNAARNIKKLLRQGCRASDITVIVRDLDAYRDELLYSFRKYELPFFNDERQPVNTQPLVVLIKYLLRSVNNSLKSDDILSAAKTGLMQVSDERINNIENYIYLWNINGSKWTKPFTNSTKGFVSDISDADKRELEEINETRQALISPVLYLKKQAESKEPKEICTAIYNAVIMCGADKMLAEYARNLYDKGFVSLAREQGRIWDIVMDTINQLATTLCGEITLKEFEKLFSLIIGVQDIGVLPSGIDNITIGQADRIRTDNPKAVFVLGANEGVFPREASSTGLLSENERKLMLDNDFKLYYYNEHFTIQERYFAYMACCCASKRLYVSYINSGKEAAPSEIVTDIINIVGDVKQYDFNDIEDIDLIESTQNAFELLSENYFTQSVFHSSLRNYFSDAPKLATLKALAENEDFVIKDKKTSLNLFEKNMYISASRIEDYYNCPFRYFCKFALNAKPREKAEINPMKRGTIIHYVLEMIISETGSSNLSRLSEEEIKKLVDKYIADYFRVQMGNAEGLPNSFGYNFSRLSRLIYSVVIHLAKQFDGCDFETKAFELPIDRDGAVKPEILPLDSGGSIQLRGSIDRVDTCEIGGNRYVRVVDYKSGNKTFNLSDVLAGLNLQMFVYLFSLCTDKNAQLNGIPAGVLYMHSARDVFNFSSRLEAGDTVDCEEDKSFKMKGLVLDDGNNIVAAAMENGLAGRYIPVRMKANGELTGQLITLEELGMLHNKINELIINMGNELQNGAISQNPVKNNAHKSTCDYCDYSEVCANKRLIEYRVTPDLSAQEVKQALRKEYKGDAAMD